MNKLAKLNMPAQDNFVCTACRTSRRTCGHRKPRCQSCRGPMVRLGQHWRVPKKADDAAWKKVRELIAQAAIKGHVARGWSVV